MKHPLHDEELNESNVPDFAIFQNDNQRVTGLWTRGGGWIEAEESEFETLQGLAQYLRICDEPEIVMREIAEQVRNKE